MNDTTSRQIVLASTSSYRSALLKRLGLPFEVIAPMVDETPILNESPQELVMRLAQAKAQAGAKYFPNALIIGSDQVAYIDGKILGKPETRANAIAQLELASGRTLIFYNGLCVLDAAHDNMELNCIPYRVHFRTLTRSAIEAYVNLEPALNCAGSFKSEGLGIALFQRMEGDDPTALMGLPLIYLVSMLKRFDISPLTT